MAPHAGACGFSPVQRSGVRSRVAPGAAQLRSLSLAIDFMDAFGDIVYNFYGATETGWATIASPADLRAAPGTAGRPPWR